MAKKINYVLGEDSINGIVINEKIFDEELFEYKIIERDSFIDDLIDWISEAKGSDKVLMKADLKMLIQLKDDYIFSSISTNDYVKKGDPRFNDLCKELLELNDSLKNK
jgi:hypothetical protein